MVRLNIVWNEVLRVFKKVRRMEVSWKIGTVVNILYLVAETDLHGVWTLTSHRSRRDFCRLLMAGSGVSLCIQLSNPAWAFPEQKVEMVGMASWSIARTGDTLSNIARANALGFTELSAANPDIDPWLVSDGARVFLPAAHLIADGEFEGLQVNLSQHRLFVRTGHGMPIRSFPIGIGKAGWETPIGTTRIVQKRERPTWIAPDSIRAARPDLPAFVPPGPSNPLGTHALYLEWPGYLIHGTNRPLGIGRRVSHGCIRLYPEHIVELFAIAQVGMPVVVKDDPITVGWIGNSLFLEVHPGDNMRQPPISNASGTSTTWEANQISKIVMTAGQWARKLDFQLVFRMLRERRGVPIAIFVKP